MLEFLRILFLAWSTIGSNFAKPFVTVLGVGGAKEARGVGLRRFVANLLLKMNGRNPEMTPYALFTSRPTLSMAFNFSSIGASCRSSYRIRPKEGCIEYEPNTPSHRETLCWPFLHRCQSESNPFGNACNNTSSQSHSSASPHQRFCIYQSEVRIKNCNKLTWLHIPNIPRSLRLSCPVRLWLLPSSTRETRTGEERQEHTLMMWYQTELTSLSKSICHRVKERAPWPWPAADSHNTLHVRLQYTIEEK
jgi:hypothetical protein